MGIVTGSAWAFSAQTHSRISRLDIPRIQPGAELQVMFDSEDRQHVALAIYREEPAR